MSVENRIKKIRNIMWKDAGVSGDGQRIEQLVWMLFLKIFDDQEKFYELENEDYKSPLPEKIRWRNWAADPEGVTGEELIDFIDQELFPQLEEVSNGGNEYAGIIRTVFGDVNNYMKSGINIRQVINEINKIDFNKKKDRHLLNEIYENILKSLQTAGTYGEFYTPRPLTKFIVEMIDPKVGEKVIDPACGTGGFLANTLEYVRENYVNSKKDEDKLQSSIYGTELKPLPHMLAVTNMILHGIEKPTNIKRDNSLAKPLSDYTPNDRADVIVANPPFGASVQDGIEKNFPSELRSSETADLFLVLFIHMLKNNGRAGIVIPDGTLFGDGVKNRIKKKLLKECNLHTIVRLPKGVFSPYANVSTNLMFFEKGQPTKEIWYYEIPLPDGLTNQYTKTKGITHKEFDPVRSWWEDREENEHAWKVDISEIEDRNYNLDINNKNNSKDKELPAPKELLTEFLSIQKEITRETGEILEQIKENEDN